ncbi:spidroin-1-like [Schistocerca americana]|uniref:spidroin-1-like n=1 Tax=Schistocerca americana TaxID=7009 RepID=UPI001F4F2A34|nr:spidroin-1-like [Schistocerca americana]
MYETVHGERQSGRGVLGAHRGTERSASLAVNKRGRIIFRCGASGVGGEGGAGASVHAWGRRPSALCAAAAPAAPSPALRRAGGALLFPGGGRPLAASWSGGLIAPGRAYNASAGGGLAAGDAAVGVVPGGRRTAAAAAAAAAADAIKRCKTSALPAPCAARDKRRAGPAEIAAASQRLFLYRALSRDGTDRDARRPALKFR